MTKKQSFVLYNDYYKVIKILSQTEKGEIIDAIFEYVISGNTIETSPLVQGIFQMIKLKLDTDHKKYQEVCDKRKQAGKKGGEAKAKNSSKTEQEQAIDADNKQEVANDSKTKQKIASVANLADNDYDYDNDYDNDYDINKNNICRKSSDLQLSKKTKINDEFEKIWKNYIPVKTKDGGFTGKGDKKPALSEFERICKKADDNIFEEIILGVENYLQECSQTSTRTKHFVRFLKNETWKEYQALQVQAVICSEDEDEKRFKELMKALD